MPDSRVPALRTLWVFLPAFLAAISAAAGAQTRAEARQRDPSSFQPDSTRTVFSLYLIGDAGAPGTDSPEPAFRTIERSAAIAPGRSFVLFLGDNIYPDGLPEKHDTWRVEAERRLAEQSKILTRSGAAGAFLAGNHDWQNGGDDGWAAVRRQEEALAAQGIPLLPSGGCPGPAVIDIPGTLRLILLDTQWWLHAHSRATDDQCSPPADDYSVLTALTAALRVKDGRPVIVAGHHPLVTYGPHGGRFTWEDHIFPLRNLQPWLVLPLPLIGSLYPVARAAGISRQDLANPVYASFARRIDSVLTLHPPLLYAAGHEHTLQVIRGIRPYTHVVSGNGIRNHYEHFGSGPGLVFGSTSPGFMRLDVCGDGRVQLGVVETEGDPPEASEVWTLTLREPTVFPEDE